MTNIFYYGWGWFSNCSSCCWFGKCHVDFFLLYICVIDQAWSQEGWILAKLLFAFFRLQDEDEVNKNAKKNPAIFTQQAWSIKDYFIIWPKRELFPAGNPERPRWAYFASSGSQSEHKIRFFLPTCRFNHITRQRGVVNQLLGIFRF